MKKLIIAIAAVVLVATGVLAALPLILSAETIRSELAARIQAATGRATRIDGPVSFTVFPTARLSAEGIGLGGIGSDAEAFSVESVAFGLSLLPLATGTIDIYDVTITRPSILVETDESGRSNWSTAETAPGAPASIEDVIAAPTEEKEDIASEALAALDRLSIGRVKIIDGTLISRDAASGRDQRIDALNLDIRVPKLDSAGTIEGSFATSGVAHTLKLEIGERPNPARFESIPLTVTVSSEAGHVTATGTALAGDALFNGTVETAGQSLLRFAQGFGVDLPPLPAFGKFQSSARINATADLIRINGYSVDLDGMKARGGAAIALGRARPGIGLKIEAERLDTARFVAAPTAEGSDPSNAPATDHADDKIDLSPLGLIDANIDFSAAELLIGEVPVTDLGLDVQIVGGDLSATIRSASVNGAPGSGSVRIAAGGGEPTISGNIEMNGLDAAGLATLAGIDLPVDGGAVGLDVAFATRGATKTAIIERLDGKGRISFLNGHIAGLGIADKIGGDATADEIDDIDVVAEFTSLAEPVTAKGGLSWRGERFDVWARGEPRTLAAGRVSPLTIKAASRRVDFGFNGEASLAGLGSGKVSLSTPSLRDLLAFIGQPIAPGGGLGAFSIEGAVALAADSFSFQNSTFTLDGSRGVGTGKVAFGGTPKLTAELAVQTLDVTPYLVASGATKAGGSGGPASPAAAGWSNDRIAFEGLKAIDADLTVRAEVILADKIKVGPATLGVTIAGGKLSAELSDMALYSGSGAGTLTVDGAAPTPSVAASFRLLEISALPFLTDAFGLTRVDGRGSFAFDLRTAGTSQAALVAALDGDGTVYVSNGAIRGINIPKMVRTLSVETLLGWQQSSEEKTDFTELSGSFKVDKGVLTNDDLVMVGPLLRVTGAGNVDIPKRSLAYRVDPKIVASLEGQSGSGDLEGFAVPVRVEGAWDRPRIYPEIEGILQNPQKAFDQLRKLGGGLFTGAVEPQSGGVGGQSVKDKLMDEAAKGLGQLLGGPKGAAAPHAGEAPKAATAPAPAPQEASEAGQTPLDLTPPAADADNEPAPEAPSAQQEPVLEPSFDPATSEKPAVEDFLKNLFRQ